MVHDVSSYAEPGFRFWVFVALIVSRVDRNMPRSVLRLLWKGSGRVSEREDGLRVDHWGTESRESTR